MDRGLRDAWVKNLRSGDFVQDAGNLCSVLSDGAKAYCCLGVLADTNGCPVPFENVGLNCARARETRLGSTGLFVQSELELLGLTEDEQSRLVGMNDNEQLSFPAIADWIEENL